MTRDLYPRFPGRLLKNDGLFLYGSLRDRPFVFAYEQKQTEVVYGPSCKVDHEIDVERCRLDRVPLVRRRGGGGTVVLAEGMVVTVVVDERRDRPLEQIYKEVNAGLGAALLPAVSLKLVPAGTSDLTSGNRKVCGSSLYLGRTPALYYYQSSLMVSCDLRLLERYLRYPPREPDYRAGRSHTDFCTTLREQGATRTPAEIAEVLRTRLAACLRQGSDE
jgi:lipoate-protein ligase A